ncbi:MAG: hypothetical protein ACOCXZ_02605 [Chloroflexota bacterium]
MRQHDPTQNQHRGLPACRRQQQAEDALMLRPASVNHRAERCQFKQEANTQVDWILAHDSLLYDE